MEMEFFRYGLYSNNIQRSYIEVLTVYQIYRVPIKGCKISNAFQDEEECDCGSIFQCIATRSSCIPPEGKGKREKECKEDPNLKSEDEN